MAHPERKQKCGWHIVPIMMFHPQSIIEPPLSLAFPDEGNNAD